jgi:hypothetical protein
VAQFEMLGIHAGPPPGFGFDKVDVPDPLQFTEGTVIEGDEAALRQVIESFLRMQGASPEAVEQLITMSLPAFGSKPQKENTSLQDAVRENSPIVIAIGIAAAGNVLLGAIIAGAVFLFWLAEPTLQQFRRRWLPAHVFKHHQTND